MDALLIAINSKFIHTNNAVRSICVNSELNLDFIEFTIKDPKNKIIDTILNFKTKILAFSCYIWNIEIIKEIVPTLKKKGYTIIFGGPEVSYSAAEYLKNDIADFVVQGEGEIVTSQLIEALVTNATIYDIENIAYKIDNEILVKDITNYPNLKELKVPFYFKKDRKHIKNKIQYIEMSRGCPFKCAYCLASLENRIRYFNLRDIKTAITYLMEHGAKTFKFLDRTFNANIKYALDMFEFLIKNHIEGTVFQFEITLDILDKKIIQYLNDNAPKGLFRFEVGIQSLNKKTTKLVNRKQNNKIIFENINMLNKGNVVDLHLDLIAGLPKEGIKSFEKTFNKVIALEPKELQLGFLKMLKGTSLRKNAKLYNYEYSLKPPYEITSNKSLNPKEVYKIKLCEEILEKYVNSHFMDTTIKHLFKKIKFNPFKFMISFGEYWVSNDYKFIDYQLQDIYLRLYEFIKLKHKKHSKVILNYLKYDYLLKSNLKPKRWWDENITKKQFNVIIKQFYRNDKTYSLDELRKHSFVTEFKRKYLIVIFQKDSKNFHIM